jgi:hypothetical protein
MGFWGPKTPKPQNPTFFELNRIIKSLINQIFKDVQSQH